MAPLSFWGASQAEFAYIYDGHTAFLAQVMLHGEGLLVVVPRSPSQYLYKHRLTEKKKIVQKFKPNFFFFRNGVTKRKDDLKIFAQRLFTNLPSSSLLID